MLKGRFGFSVEMNEIDLVDLTGSNESCPCVQHLKIVKKPSLSTLFYSAASAATHASESFLVNPTSR